MLKIIKISALLVVLNVAWAPYASLMSHALAHHFFTFEHDHAHGSQTDDTRPQQQGQEHDHVVTLDSLSPAPAVSIVKSQLPESVLFIIPEKVFNTTLSARLRVPSAIMNQAPPPLMEPFISLSLHPTNAPPLR
jgi:hypothetical protein